MLICVHYCIDVVAVVVEINSIQMAVVERVFELSMHLVGDIALNIRLRKSKCE